MISSSNPYGTDGLATFAVTEGNSRGRRFPVALAKDRNAFQRDYTRLLHSTSFRQLQGKTQVFSAGLHDQSQHRTRLIHSIEVDQIARSISRRLGLNQDLCSALSIGHDLGHAPFGHMGQDILNDLFQDIGGFEHNFQAIRIVDILESPYMDHQGLNLMFETREGLLKHCDKNRIKAAGPLGERHAKGYSPTLEAQVVDAADQLAYLHGDLEDAVRKGVLTTEMLMDDLPCFKRFWQLTVKKNPGHSLPNNTQIKNPATRQKSLALLNDVWRAMLSDGIEATIINSQSSIRIAGVSSLADVRKAPVLIAADPDRTAVNKEIRRFSHEYIYDAPAVAAARKDDASALMALYEKSAKDPDKWGLPSKVSRQDHLDWLAGLTDTYVLHWFESEKLLEKAKDHGREPHTACP